MAQKRRDRKAKTMSVIYITLVIIVCLIASFVMVQIFHRDPPPAEKPAVSYVPISLPEQQMRTGSLILVNKSNPYSFADNPAVVSMSSAKSYGLRDNTLKANPIALEAFDRMMTALYTNVPDSQIVVMTAYRSEADQTALNNGTPAGCSDFHTGMSFELKDTGAWEPVSKLSKYSWLYENAHKFGFIVRYPDDTEEKSFSSITGVDEYSYVFRYVGVAHASYIYANGICLEEYLELLRSSHKQESPLSIRAGDSKTYEVYYCDATPEIQVPEKLSYEISGDNMNGYIVTVSKSK